MILASIPVFGIFDPGSFGLGVGIVGGGGVSLFVITIPFVISSSSFCFISDLYPSTSTSFI